MTTFQALRELPASAQFKKGDVMVVFGELFSRGYANGIVDQAEKSGMTIVRSTVGRRDADGTLRPLTTEELQNWPKPYINIPLEAGFDMEPAADGTTPVDQLKSVKMSEWDSAKLDWSKIEHSRKAGVERFRKNVTAYMRELDALIPKGANVLFVHTMAGGVPRAKIFMPTMNKVFKGTGDRHTASEMLQKSDMGKFADQNFDEVTAHTFQHLLELSHPIRERIERDGGRAHYIAYGYHGTEVLVRGEYRWQTYTPYFQGWAKMKLEKHAEDAWKKGIRAQVFNCPEILTNSSSIFLGVELSLYPLMGALQREGTKSPYAQKLVQKCQSLLKDGVTIQDVLKATDAYITSDLMQRYMKYDLWPQHNGKEQMECMLDSSAHLISLHKDEKQLITYLLSEEVFKACGEVMFREAWNPKAPVWWLGHDVLAKTLATSFPCP
ncbi:MAG: hypothetical protein NDI61_13415 [Bdellovibrionaceae bacterium]|nr:hypothetical protein [Pseudobdellovibrionaceae bacterium]